MASNEEVGTIDAPSWDLFDGDREGRETVLQLNFGYVVGRYIVSDNGHHEISVRPVDGRPDRQESYLNKDAASRYLKLFDDFRPITIAGVPASSGLISIMGSANTSKSPLAEFLSGGKVVHFGEPNPNSITRASVACAELIEALLGTDQVVALDSVKNLLSRSGGGAAGARGVSRSVFPMLSDWSAVAASLGKAIVVPVNPSTDDAAAMGEIQEAMQSNVSMAIFASGGNNYSFLTRTPGRGKRLEGRLTATFEDNKIRRVVVSGAGRLIAEEQIDEQYLSSLASHVINTRDKMDLFRTHNQGE